MEDQQRMEGQCNERVEELKDEDLKDREKWRTTRTFLVDPARRHGDRRRLSMAVLKALKCVV